MFSALSMAKLLTSILAAFAMATALAPPATAAPPPNDPPTAPGGFEPYTASNGRPSEAQAVAELAEATPDSRVPRCLGRTSFARTVWYRVPEAPTPQQVTVEAMGRTLDVVDLAAFVQPPVPPPPPPPPPPARASQLPASSEPNACSGIGAGEIADAEEPTSGVTLHVPAYHPVLIQVGRRGAIGSPDDERAVLSLDVQPLAATARPPGDGADTVTPRARGAGTTDLHLYGATLTPEDPAQPACPSLGSVWRRVIPGGSGRRLIRVRGPGVETLTVFSGRRPTADNVLDCVNRERAGALEMVVPVRRRRPVWVRIGTDNPAPDAVAALQVADGARATVIDGGPGGFDPTTGGPAGGFPGACMTARTERARVTGPRPRGAAAAYNRFRRIPLALRVRGASICDVELRIKGPRNRVYARGRAIRLRGRTTVRLPRLRTFGPGRYRLLVTAVSPTGRRVSVRTRVTGRLG